MGRQTLQSKYGPVRLLKKNPRLIRPDAFKKLVDSIRRDPDFMIANPIKVDETGTVRQCRGRYYGTRSFYPNYDWTHKQIMEALRRSNLCLSNEYHIASRSFAGGLMPHSLLAVEKRAPDLFRQLEYYYPLLKASLCRSQWRNEQCLTPKPQKRKARADALAEAGTTPPSAAR